MSTTVENEESPIPGKDEIYSTYAERKGEFDATFIKLKDIFGSDDTGLARIEARTFTEYAFRKYQFGSLAAETVPKEEPKWEQLYPARLPNIIATTRTIQYALEILREECGVDIIANRKVLSDNPALFQEATDIIGDSIEQENGFSELPQEAMARVFAKDILNLFGGSRAFFKKGIATTEKLITQLAGRPSLQMAGLSQQSYYEHIFGDISRMRYEAYQQLRKLVGDDINEFLDFSERSIEGLKKSHASSEMIESILESQKQELDYTILPPGTQLEEVARQIVEESPEGEKATVDLERLAVLEEIRQLYGPEKCFLMRGKKTGKEMADDAGTLISEDYIGLIMQHHNEDGNVIREDCLAISPIAHKHAGYIVRQDASADISWREILSLPKAEAIKYFNARRLRFDPVSGESKYDAYVKKVTTLLTCETEEFNSDYRLRRTKGGDYEMIFRPQNVGRRILASTQY